MAEIRKNREGRVGMSLGSVADDARPSESRSAETGVGPNVVSVQLKAGSMVDNKKGGDAGGCSSNLGKGKTKSGEPISRLGSVGGYSPFSAFLLTSIVATHGSVCKHVEFRQSTRALLGCSAWSFSCKVCDSKPRVPLVSTAKATAKRDFRCDLP